MISDTRVIVVVGATGNQGGSVVDTFIHLPGWHVRGLTRDISGSKAQALIQKGVEMVCADLDDPNTLPQAFQGARVIFSNTDCWAALSDPRFQARAKEAGKTPLEYTYDVEVRQGRNVFDVASKVDGLERLIVSSLSDASKWSKGKYRKVYHFDAKAHAVEYGRTKYPDLWDKTSVIQVGWYLSNWSSNPYMMPKKTDDEIVEFTIGVPEEQQFPMIAPESDSGPFVLALLKESPGKNLIAYREWMSMGELTRLFGQAKGVRTRCTVINMDVNHPDEFVAGYAENMGHLTGFGFEGRDDRTVIHPRDLTAEPRLASAADWVRSTDWSAVLMPPPLFGDDGHLTGTLPTNAKSVQALRLQYGLAAGGSSEG